ncbi:hypothetical protein CRG98_020683 [Punica granatum]|uniref:Uncharacterized protein n=1 Tax=Punica granatum TaxID=22663 RepID=A0A2I0JRJ5_PUNGR|nr:hypothetical protein CRG98_020683 [Punica granatum]
MKHLTEEVHSLLRRIISRRDKSIRAEEAATADLLGLLLESNMKEQHENRGNKYTGMSIQDVIEECYDDLVRGYEAIPTSDNDQPLQPQGNETWKTNYTGRGRTVGAHITCPPR